LSYVNPSLKPHLERLLRDTPARLELSRDNKKTPLTLMGREALYLRGSTQIP
jgi:hypothetical protein